jgi:hypothetical protein
MSFDQAVSKSIPGSGCYPGGPPHFNSPGNRKADRASESVDGSSVVEYALHRHNRLHRYFTTHMYRRVAMLYERTEGPITPFHEDETGYIFRFFCDDEDPTPREQSMPKGNPLGYVCRCRSRISVENMGDGPYLRFWRRPESHYAARPRRKPIRHITQATEGGRVTSSADSVEADLWMRGYCGDQIISYDLPEDAIAAARFRAAVTEAGFEPSTFYASGTLG